MRKGDHAMFCCVEEPAYKTTRYAQRERERDTKSITLLSKVCATVTNEQPTFTKGKSHFI